jgi:hypothetical protein
MKAGSGCLAFHPQERDSGEIKTDVYSIPAATEVVRVAVFPAWV